jgi:3-dehydrotetronate 4-kinase
MKSRLLFAAIADDDTGASDLAGMLAEQGLRTLMVIDLPTVAQFTDWSDGYQAVVMAEGTRNLAPSLARERTLRALRILEERKPRLFQIKYCSTFDSTPEGNIGPTIDAALDGLEEDFTIALPALPVNGRTTYQGYHFVNGQLLSDSPMRNHPLTPMTNPNLVELLGRQTERRVGLASYADVEGGADHLRRRFESLREQGTSIAVVDCLSDVHLETICRAAADLRLITGSSALGMRLPAIWRERGWIADESERSDPRDRTKTTGHGCLVVAGSCSQATRGQNDWLAAEGWPTLHIPPQELLDAGGDHSAHGAVIKKALAQLAAGRHCLLSTTDEPAEVQRVQEWAAERGLTVPALGQAIASAMSDLVFRILEEAEVGGLVVAGGETSGALCRRLELGALRIGRNVEPGVPLCFSLGRFKLPVVLKSGNFGSPDFYGKAFAAIARHDHYLR